MKRFKQRLKYEQVRFQTRPRMRVPSRSLTFMYRVHVVDAIRRSGEIDTDDLHGKALRDLTHGQNFVVFSELSSLVQQAMSGESNDKLLDAAERVMSGVGQLDDDGDVYPSIVEFDRRFLNNKGLMALLNALIVEAAELDLPTIDAYRGGDTLVAAYGPRRTRHHKKLGAQLQRHIKNFNVVDEPAAMEAADRYVKYRYLHDGSLPDYKRRQELEGNVRHDNYLRVWFRKFDQALGFPPPPLGRPSERRDHR